VTLFPFLVLSWWCGSLVPCVGLYPALYMKSGGGNKSFISLVTYMIFTYKDARSDEHKILYNLFDRLNILCVFLCF
jgi:hypothetical protein